ncbi:hypothetical protein QL285_085664 [Trifolium repens]|nr:hypothetical protein QL285_085664 [Trifolium repens]
MFRFCSCFLPSYSFRSQSLSGWWWFQIRGSGWFYLCSFFRRVSFLFYLLFCVLSMVVVILLVVLYSKHGSVLCGSGFRYVDLVFFFSTVFVFSRFVSGEILSVSFCSVSGKVVLC